VGLDSLTASAPQATPDETTYPLHDVRVDIAHFEELSEEQGRSPCVSSDFPRRQLSDVGTPQALENSRFAGETLDDELVCAIPRGAP
jgi:hypothetical protein